MKTHITGANFKHIGLQSSKEQYVRQERFKCVTRGNHLGIRIVWVSYVAVGIVQIVREEGDDTLECFINPRPLQYSTPLHYAVWIAERQIPATQQPTNPNSEDANLTPNQ